MDPHDAIELVKDVATKINGFGGADVDVSYGEGMFYALTERECMAIAFGMLVGAKNIETHEELDYPEDGKEDEMAHNAALITVRNFTSFLLDNGIKPRLHIFAESTRGDGHGEA